MKSKLLTSVTRISRVMGLSRGGIYANYINRPDKANHARALDVGTFIIENDISNEKLHLVVRLIKENEKLFMQAFERVL